MENFKINKPSAAIHYRERMVAAILKPDVLQARWAKINYTMPKQLMLEL